MDADGHDDGAIMPPVIDLDVALGGGAIISPDVGLGVGGSRFTGQAGFGTGEPTSRTLYLLGDRPSADNTLVGGRAGGGNDLLAGSAGNDSISAEDLIEDIVDSGAGSERARIDVRLDRVQRVEDTRRGVGRARGG